MGYDMHTVIKPEGEQRAVARIRAEWDEAIKVRDAFPKNEQGSYTNAEYDSGEAWDGAPRNASAAYRAAQHKAHDLYERMRETERSYFRLNIWGMGNVRRAMLAIGMAYEAADTGCDWPDIDWESPAGQVAEALDSGSFYANADMDDLSERYRGGESDREWAEAYFARYYGGQTFSDMDLEQATGYVKTKDAILRDHPEGGTTIPVHKFGSNDGWIVTPDECLNALAAWHQRTESERDDALSSAGIDLNDPAWARLWRRWLDYLELAAHCDGFEVH